MHIDRQCSGGQKTWVYQLAWQGSSFRHTQLCDGKFIGADLNRCDLFFADIDYADFTNANLEFASLIWTKNCYWVTFTDANLYGAFLDDCAFADDKITGVKGLDIYMVCPEEGSFIAWWKSCDNKIVKLMIPEQALRTGGHREWCRASEALILEIYDGDNTCNETTGLLGDDKVYSKGEVVKAEKFDGSLYHGGEGIEFRLSKAEAETIKYKEKEEQEDDE